METDLKQQVEREAAELSAAPRVELVHNSAGRCHFCGAVTRNLIFVERVGEKGQQQERYRGEDCCNG